MGSGGGAVLLFELSSVGGRGVWVWVWVTRGGAGGHHVCVSMRAFVCTARGGAEGHHVCIGFVCGGGQVCMCVVCAAALAS